MSLAAEGFPGDNDGTSPSGGEGKKRNKLGYHRTAVACVHCRRRKIRCIPSQDAAEQRCQNCIRLRKECLFHPVDQNAASGTRRSQSAPGLDETDGGQTNQSSPTTPNMPTSYPRGALEDSEMTHQSNSARTWAGGSGRHEATNAHETGWNATVQQPQPQLLQSNMHTIQAAVPYYAQATSPPIPSYGQPPYLYTQDPSLYVQSTQHAYSHQIPGRDHQHFTGPLAGEVTPTQQYYSYGDPSFPQLERSATMPANYSQVNQNPMPGLQSSPYEGSHAFPPSSFAPAQPQTGNWQGQQSSFNPDVLPSQRGRQGRHRQNPG